jgi:phosphotriesterase-related protein
MNRRTLLSLAAVSLLPAAARAQAGRVHTVTGPIGPADLGTVLMHEHVLVDFIGADQVSPARYDPEEAFQVALPFLKQARELGCRTLVECTPAFIGRDPALLKRLSAASGLHILTNTGYYGASGGKFLPAHARTETAEQLAARWIKEAREGIGGTGIRPAFLKIGVDGAPLPEVNRKLVRAAALTHRATGLRIHQHTGSGAAALEALDLLKAEGVDGSAFVWVHGQSEQEPALHQQAARRGAWVEFDGIAPDSIPRHVDLVLAMKTAVLLDRVLISHDAGWYNVGEPKGGRFRPFDTLFTAFLPALRKAGGTPDDERRLLVLNPRAALTPAAPR